MSITGSCRMLFVSNPLFNISICLCQTISVRDDTIAISVRCLHTYRLAYCCCYCHCSYCYCYYCYISRCLNNPLIHIFDGFNCGSSYMWISIHTCAMSQLTMSMCEWIVVNIIVVVHYCSYYYLNFMYCQ